MTKLQAYRKGLYEFPPPPVYSGMWDAADWIKYIDQCGKWTVEVLS